MIVTGFVTFVMSNFSITFKHRRTRTNQHLKCVGTFLYSTYLPSYIVYIFMMSLFSRRRAGFNIIHDIKA